MKNAETRKRLDGFISTLDALVPGSYKFEHTGNKGITFLRDGGCCFGHDDHGDSEVTIGDSFYEDCTIWWSCKDCKRHVKVYRDRFSGAVRVSKNATKFMTAAKATPVLEGFKVEWFSKREVTERDDRKFQRVAVKGKPRLTKAGIALYEKLEKDQVKIDEKGKERIDLRPRKLRGQRTLSIVANQGVGKSYTVINDILHTWYKDYNRGNRDNRESFKLLVICSRRSLGSKLESDLGNSLGELGVVTKFYLDNKKNEPLESNCDVLVISPEATVRLQQSGQEFKFNFDCVMIDEFSAFLGHMLSSTLKECRSDVMKTLEMLLKEAKSLITMDADHDDFCCNILKKYRGMEQSTMILNTTKTNKNNYFYYDIERDRQHCYDLIERDLKTGTNLYICCDSKRDSDTISEIMQKRIGDDLKCLVINADKNNCFKDFAQVNEIWDSYNLVIVSPTVSYGLSFDKEHFDKVYAFFTGKSCLANICNQMTNRCRHLSVNEMHICVTSKQGYIPETDLKQDRIEYEFVGRVWTQKKSLFNDIYIHFRTLARKCDNAFAQTLAELQCEAGGCVWLPSNIKYKRQVGSSEQKAARGQCVTNWIDQFIAAETMTSEEYEQISEQERVDRVFDIKRMNLKDKFCLIDLPTEGKQVRELYDTAGEAHFQGYCDNLIDYFTPLHARDAAGDREEKQITLDKLAMGETVDAAMRYLGLRDGMMSVESNLVVASDDPPICERGLEIYHLMKLARLQNTKKQLTQLDFVRVLKRFARKLYGFDLLEKDEETSRQVRKGKRRVNRYGFQVRIPQMRLEMVLSALRNRADTGKLTTLLYNLGEKAKKHCTPWIYDGTVKQLILKQLPDDDSDGNKLPDDGLKASVQKKRLQNNLRDWAGRYADFKCYRDCLNVSKALVRKKRLKDNWCHWAHRYIERVRKNIYQKKRAANQRFSKIKHNRSEDASKLKPVKVKKNNTQKRHEDSLQKKHLEKYGGIREMGLLEPSANSRIAQKSYYMDRLFKINGDWIHAELKNADHTLEAYHQIDDYRYQYDLCRSARSGYELQPKQNSKLYYNMSDYEIREFINEQPIIRESWVVLFGLTERNKSFLPALKNRYPDVRQMEILSDGTHREITFV